METCGLLTGILLVHVSCFRVVAIVNAPAGTSPMKPITVRRPKVMLFVMASILFILSAMTIVLWLINDNDPIAMEDLEAAAVMKYTETPRPRYNFLLLPSIQISEYGKTRRTSVIVVKSAIGNIDRRDAIRATWASQSIFRTWRFIVIFLVGRPPGKDNAMEKIQAEHEKFEDILLLDVDDTAEHVPDKTLAGMQWVADSLPRSWIYSSADDDMSLNVPNFVRYIEDTISKSSPYILEDNEFLTLNLPIMCIYSYQSKDPPARDRQSKWYMAKERYPPDYWPPYCRGGWYSMPVNLAGKLYDTSRWMEYMHLDDVWITGLMRIQYATAIKKESPTMDFLLDAAPLSLRSERALGWNSKEGYSEVIVSHAWGNIQGRKVDVAGKLKENWRSWSSSFLASER